MILAFESDDTIDGLGGNDTICAGSGNDVVDGGGGDDDLRGETGSDTVSFGSSPAGVTVDLVQGTATGNGTDTVTSFANVEGGPFNDTIFGNGGANILSGLAGKDTINGFGGPDEILGGSGSDRLFGGKGDDVLRGGNGWDRLFGGHGNDDLLGESGVDTADYGGAPSAVVADLWKGTATGGHGSDKLDSVENVAGSKHGDTLRGDGKANKLLGRAGNDVILGRGGNDVLSGGAGTNTVTFAGAKVPVLVDLVAGICVWASAATRFRVSRMSWVGATTTPSSGTRGPMCSRVAQVMTCCSAAAGSTP